MHFLDKLDDSPIFRKQLQGLEESADVLRDRCQKFHKGCWKYTKGLGEAYDGDISFASAMDSFGGGHDDPLSVAIGGPVLSKFTIALREIGTYKEVLRSQVEHMLTDRLMHFANGDIQDVKDLRKRFEKASLHYDQVRERFLCLKKGAKMDVVSEVEEDLRRSKSTFEQTRFNLATMLSSIEARKKFEFLEAVSETMSAHLCYFRQGYDLLLQLEPYIQQVLTYAQQSRERATYEQVALASRMQEYTRQVEHDNQLSFSDFQIPRNGDGIHAVGRSSHKMIEAVMQSTPRGKVQIIKQGYLLKRSSSLRGDWKRRFFVLDSRGMLYYYRKQLGKTMGSPKKQSSQCRTHLSIHHHTGLLGRFLSSHHHGSMHEDTTVAHQTVNLLTSTIKPDAEQTDLRFCFQIISPLKSYSLQAENALDRMDWIDKITGVIASLLNAQNLEQASHSHRLSHSTVVSGLKRTGSESSSLSGSSDADHTHLDDPSAHFATCGEKPPRSPRASVEQERPIDALKRVPGNNICADCNSPEPDWASLNLGVLLCIQCSGVHRNLGVHVSKVRSLTLDVKVWEPSVICLFQSLGNMFANSVWEGLRSELEGAQTNMLLEGNTEARTDSDPDRLKRESFLNKPGGRDPLAAKEKYIRSKYVEKRFACRAEFDPEITSVASMIWSAVGANDKKNVYRLLICANGDVNIKFDQAARRAQPSTQVVVSQPTLKNNEDTQNLINTTLSSSTAHDPSVTRSNRNVASNMNSFNLTYFEEQGCTLLHLACHCGDIAMVELLLQFGARTNEVDNCGRTPLHQCIISGSHDCAKLLLSRGANPATVDNTGKTPLQTAMELGDLADEELFVLLS